MCIRSLPLEREQAGKWPRMVSDFGRFWSGRRPRLCFQQARGRCSCCGNHALSRQALGPRCVKSEDRQSLRPCWVRARHRPGCRAEPPLGLAQLGSRYRQPPSGSPQPRPEAARASAPSGSFPEGDPGAWVHVWAVHSGGC